MNDPRRDAFEILKRVEDAGAYASVLLEGRGRVYEDPRDTALVTEMVLGVLRRRSELDHAITAVSKRPLPSIDPSVLVALRLGAYALLMLDRVPDFAAVDTAVGLVKSGGHRAAAGFVNGVLRNIAREGRGLLPKAPAEGDASSLALFHSHPPWWTRRVVERLGWERARAILAANNEPAATTLAAWPSAASPEGLSARLEAEGVVTVPGSFLPSARRVVSGVPQSTSVFREGQCWIQDEASQLAVQLFGDAVGPKVADLCAAPGGKTLALAARLAPGGLILAADRNVKRLRRLRENVARLHADGVRPVAADLTATPLAVSERFDEVLVDAPCSGTGTLRRHPEIRWRLDPLDLATLALRQGRLLDGAAALVRPGGRLVYSVCSIEPEEGEAVVASFLDRHPSFARAEPRDGLPRAAWGLIGADGALRTESAGGLDGFYAALLVRRDA